MLQDLSSFLVLLRRGALAGLLALTACQASGSPPAHTAAAADDAPLLRTYTVPPEQARSIERALASALANGKDLPPHGTVEQLPNGQLVVVAPAGIHEGIAALIKGLDAGAAAPVRTAEFDYWVVVGEAAQAAAGVDAPDIGPALAAIVREQGPMQFTVLEKARVASLIDESAKVHGNRLEVRQVVTESGGKLIADVDLEVDTAAEFDPRDRCKGGSCKQFRTRVNVAAGQLLVVGQTGVAGPAGAGPRSVFYILRGRTAAEGG